MTNCFLIKNKVIVFGSNNLNFLGIVRSLGEKHIKPICVLLSLDHGYVFDSKYPSKCVYADSMEDGLDYIVQNYNNEKVKPIILPSEDNTSSYVDLHYGELRDKYYIHNGRENGRITYFMDKVNISILAEKYGFKIPKYWLYSKENNDISQVEYPCFVKADKSLNGFKKAEEVCYNRNDLQTFVENNDFQNLVIQKYIDKKDELCCQGFSINGGEEIYIPFHETFLQYTKKAFGGYVVLKPNVDYERDSKIKSILREISYTGLFSAEFLIDKNGDYYFTEINLRNDGFSYFATAGGANLPFLFCRSLINGHIDVSDVVLKDKVVGLNEHYYFNQTVRYGEESIFGFIWKFLTADSHLLSNKYDKGPFFSYIRQLVKNKMMQKTSI